MKQQNLFSLFLPKITRTNGVNPRLFFDQPISENASPHSHPQLLHQRFRLGPVKKWRVETLKEVGKKKDTTYFFWLFCGYWNSSTSCWRLEPLFLIQRTSSVVPVHLHGMRRSKSFELGHKGVGRGIPFLIDSTVDLSATLTTILLQPSVCPRET